jgi:hypothetical protein
MSLHRLVPAALVVALVAGCSGVSTSSTTGEGSTTGASSSADQACPRRARGPEGVVDRARVPTGLDERHAALLCRYLHTSDGLELDGARPLDARTAERLHEAFTHRSRAMVDCQERAGKPLYAVLDQDADGGRRVVTVDLAFCSSIVAEVAGHQLWGLANRTHRRLLAAAWGAG